MNVIFLTDVPGSGLAGEVKTVKNGFARNFLIPKKLAVVATHDELQRIETIRKVGEERRLKEEKDLRLLAEYLGELSVSLTAKVGPTGRLYGAITSTQVTEELSRLTEREFDRRSVHLAETIHELGEYEAEVRFPQGITATVKVIVEAEGAQGALAREQKEEAAQAVAEAQQAEAEPAEEAEQQEEATPAVAEVQQVEAEPEEEAEQQEEATPTVAEVQQTEEGPAEEVEQKEE